MFNGGDPETHRRRLETLEASERELNGTQGLSADWTGGRVTSTGIVRLDVKLLFIKTRKFSLLMLLMFTVLSVKMKMNHSLIFLSTVTLLPNFGQMLV